jgi:hemoglobin/transferrin/lactoferrin receptor protein
MGIALVCTGLSAQTTPNMEAKDTLKSINLLKVVVSANKDPEVLRTVNQQVQIIKTEDLQQLQAQSTAEVLSNMGNVFVQKSQMGGGSPVLRGFEASRILLVVDGVRMNNLIYRSGHLQNAITMDNNSLERAQQFMGVMLWVELFIFLPSHPFLLIHWDRKFSSRTLLLGIAESMKSKHIMLIFI